MADEKRKVYGGVGSKKMDRVIRNPFLGHEKAGVDENVKEGWVPGEDDGKSGLFEAVDEVYKAILAGAELDSMGKGVYGGVAGVVEALRRYADRLGASQSACQVRAEALLDQSATKIVQGKSRHRHKISYWCGQCGILVMQAKVKAGGGDWDGVRDISRCVRALYPEVDREGVCDELLYGRAGYLSGLMQLYRVVDQVEGATLDEERRALEEEREALVEVIVRVRADLFTIGRAFAQTLDGKVPAPLPPIFYTWHGSLYLGAAHGITGILYIMILSHGIKRMLAQERQIVHDSLAYFASLQLESGNYPTQLSSSSRDRLVQWCHGAPAFALLYTLAYEQFSWPEYLVTAESAAEHVWRFGLLRKGVGLCHGIGGNGYVFLKLFQVTRNVRHWHRARLFAEAERKYREKYSLWTQADEPYSLANGIAGYLAFLLDLCEPEKSSFPGLDL